MFKQTSHGGTGFTTPHVRGLFIRFQFLRTKPTERRCIFVKKDMCFNKIDISRYCTEQDLEICAVQLETKTSILIILGLYRSPSGVFNQFSKGLDATLTLNGQTLDICTINQEYARLNVTYI
jgi:hypothetical protein